MLNSRKETGQRAYRGSLLAALVLILGFVMMNTGIKADAAKAKFVKKAGRTYYYDAKGRKATGLKKIKGKWYYFSKKGVRYQKGWQTIKGKKYYFSKKNGEAYTGLKKISGKLYLFAKDGKRYGSGLITYSGKTYYVKGGNVQTGWRNLKGNRYCFSDQDGAALTGWQTIGGKEYYFDGRGGMQKGQWIGDKYVGAKGYVTKEKGEEEEQTPGFQFPSTPKVEPDIPEFPVVEQTSEVYYHETYSNMIFNDINRFRESQELEPLNKATGTLLTKSILRGMQSIADFEASELPIDEAVKLLASHGGGQIGLGSLYPEGMVEEEENSYLHATNKWMNSPTHRKDLVSKQYDYMAVAVMILEEKGIWSRESVSVIVTFGTQGTEHYYIDGKDMGVFNPDTAPLYGYSVRYADGDSIVSKETTVSKVGAPYEKWNEYLNSYKTIK